MKKLRLIRTQQNEKQTLGILQISDNNKLDYYFHSLELPWKDNKRGVSCIPEGRYRVKKRFSQKYGEHLHVMDVPDRDMILIHRGNFNYQTMGCILVGTGLSDINGDGLLDVTNSRAAMQELLDNLGNEEYELSISNAKYNGRI